MTIRVVLADDHTIVREGLEQILNGEPDVEVVGRVGDGESAVRAVQELQPDVAVLDIAMPGLSGIGAARRIREACPTTRVVMLSMHADQEHVSRAMMAGARGYILKECAGSELVKAIRAVHDGQSRLCQRAADAMIRTYGADSQEPLADLSERERQVLRLVVGGLSSVEIGKALSLSPKTIETYRCRIHRKLGTDDVVDLVKFAVRHNIISLD